MKQVFQLKGVVRVISSKGGSINQVGDIGIITDIDHYHGEIKVTVDGRSNYENWHTGEELEIIK